MKKIFFIIGCFLVGLFASCQSTNIIEETKTTTNTPLMTRKNDVYYGEVIIEHKFFNNNKNTCFKNKEKYGLDENHFDFEIVNGYPNFSVIHIGEDWFNWFRLTFFDSKTGERVYIADQNLPEKMEQGRGKAEVVSVTETDQANINKLIKILQGSPMIVFEDWFTGGQIFKVSNEMASAMLDLLNFKNLENQIVDIEQEY